MIYIIVLNKFGEDDFAFPHDLQLVESAWDNRQLAEQALRQHADEADIPTSHYAIIERKLNYIKGGLK